MPSHVTCRIDISPYARGFQYHAIIPRMESGTAALLLSLNEQFYQTFAVQFSSTRQRLQPGVSRLLETFQPGGSILDLGCGNGEFGRQLAAAGFHGCYVGLDANAELLSQAHLACQSAGLHCSFHLVDLASPDWDQSLQGQFTCAAVLPFTDAVAFAVLHHIPSQGMRSRMLRQIRRMLVSAGGRFLHSEWQFLNSPRLRARLQPWDRIGLSEADVDPGDYLLDWRLGGTGLRYVHHFTLKELADLARGAGFEISETFYSDGEAESLGLYQVWTCK
jgi:tRNA (uracil-5-)-methyltransferase TRM9